MKINHYYNSNTNTIMITKEFTEGGVYYFLINREPPGKVDLNGFVAIKAKNR